MRCRNQSYQGGGIEAEDTSGNKREVEVGTEVMNVGIGTRGLCGDEEQINRTSVGHSRIPPEELTLGWFRSPKVRAPASGPHPVTAARHDASHSFVRRTLLRQLTPFAVPKVKLT